MRAFLTINLLLLTLLLTAQQVEPVVQFGHIGRTVTDMTLSPDGEMMATTDGQYLKLWDVASGLEFRAFSGGNAFFGGISNLNFTADNNTIVYKAGGNIIFRAVESDDINTVLYIDSTEDDTSDTDDSDDEVSEEEMQAYMNADQYKGIAFSPDRSLFVTSTGEKIEVKSYPEFTEKQVISIPKEKKKEEEETEEESFIEDFFKSIKPDALAIDPTNKFLFHKNKIYDIESGDIIKEVIPEEDEATIVTSASFSPDGKKLILGCILVNELKDSSGFDNIFEMVLQFSGSQEGEVLYIIDTTNPEIIQKKQGKGIFSVNFNQRGDKFITGHSENTFKVWNTITGDEIFSKKVEEHEAIGEEAHWSEQLKKIAPVPSAIFTPDGKNIIARGNPKELESLVIWSADNGNKIRNLGASIPPLNLEGRNALTDSLILREFEEEKVSFMTPAQKIYKGFRTLELETGRVPRASVRYDSVFFSPNGDFYVVKEKDGNLVVRESELNDMVSILETGGIKFNKIVFDQKAELVTGISRGNCRIWNSKTGELLWKNNDSKRNIGFAEFSQNGDIIVITDKIKSTVSFWAWKEKRKISDFQPILNKKLANDVRKGFGVFNDLNLEGINLPGRQNSISLPKGLGKKKRGNRINSLLKFLSTEGYYDINFSQNGDIAAIWDENRVVAQFINVETGKSFKKIIAPVKSLGISAISNHSSLQETQENEAEEYEENTDLSNDFTKILLAQLKESANIKNAFAISQNFTTYAKVVTKWRKPEENHIFLKTIGGKEKSGKNIKLEDSADYQNGLNFSPDDTKIAASSNQRNAIRIWDTQTGKITNTLEGHSGKISFGPQGKTLISSGWDRQVKIWDIEKNKLIYTFIGIRGENDFVILLPTGQYTTSRKNSRAIAFRKGRKAYPFEQFDLQFQRPDLVIETLGKNRRGSVDSNANEALATAYKNAYEKRLKSLGYDETAFTTDFSLPEVQMNKLSATSSTKKIPITIKASDTKYPLSSVHIWVNDVPVFGKAGKDISKSKMKTYSETSYIELSNGENKIQVSVFNSNRLESIRETYQVKYTGRQALPNKYIITLGSNTFSNDASMNLKYPEKDLEKFSATFENKNKGGYGMVRKIDLSGSKFTLFEFEKLVGTLKNTKVDDEVFIFTATHGVLDNDFNYYLATYDMDFTNPKNGGLAYDKLEELLNEIPARKKIVFIDACHAGEIDDAGLEEVEEIDDISDGKVRFRSIPGTSYQTMGVQNSFELMKSLFVDLRRGTGATVIAAAAGGEVAIEGDEWENGVFTYSLLKGLKEGLADTNNDGVVTVSELQFYLPIMVRRLTENRQQPTYRAENLSSDWQLWELQKDNE